VPTVELFGQARLLAGRRVVPVEAQTVGAALCELARQFPRLVGPVLEPDGRPTSAYALNLSGRLFTTDLGQALGAREQLLLLSSLSGG